jgi:GNAT superfamily N-acetyltransferase
MGNTDPVREHLLGPEHLEGCMRLVESAKWNQNAADWRLMLQIGRGWGLSLADGTLVASTVALLYGQGFAWVSMVLVLPEHQRKGYASRLLAVAIDDLKGRGLTPILDATPAGREVYRQQGFHDTWSFKRYVSRQRAGAPDAAVRKIRASDWTGILRLDREAFGASREPLLRALASRLPEAALARERGGRIAGFVLGREGRELKQIGPLVADSPETAKALLDTAISRVAAPLYLDLADHARALSGGLELQRPFTRMVYGKGAAPGNEKAMFLWAGPELG